MNLNKILIKDIDEIWELQLPWEDLDHTKIMVTGASGLIGSFFIYALIHRNIKYKSNIHIIALARNMDRLRKRFGEFSEVELVAQDVCNPIDFESSKLDYIIHAACDFQPKTNAVDPVGMCKTNVEGTFQVCELAKKTNAKIIILSSIGIYGKSEEKVPFSNETVSDIDLSDSAYAYHEGKRMAEMICASYAKQYKIKYSALRIVRVYGPTMHETDSMVLSSFLLEAAQGKDLCLKSDGTQKYSYVYVADVVSAMFILMFKGECTSYNCGEGDEIEPFNFGQIVEMIAEENQVAVHRIGMNAQDKNFYSKTVYSVLTSDALLQLGWKRNTNMRKGIHKTSRFLRQVMKEK